jgi:hypothetical protein
MSVPLVPLDSPTPNTRIEMLPAALRPLSVLTMPRAPPNSVPSVKVRMRAPSRVEPAGVGVARAPAVLGLERQHADELPEHLVVRVHRQTQHALVDGGVGAGAAVVAEPPVAVAAAKGLAIGRGQAHVVGQLLACRGGGRADGEGPERAGMGGLGGEEHHLARCQREGGVQTVGTDDGTVDDVDLVKDQLYARATAWDSQLSPVDARRLSASQRRDVKGTWFTGDRQDWARGARNAV